MCVCVCVCVCFMEEEGKYQRKMVDDSKMNPHKHISEQIHDHNVSIIFLELNFFYFVCEILLLIVLIDR